MLDILCKRNNRRYGIPRSPRQGSAMFCGLLLLLFATGTCAGCTSPCPSGCTCSEFKKRQCAVNCSSAGLTGIPLQSDLPSTTSYIKVLYLDNNDITSIGANDLTYMTNLEELYLQGNKIASIDSNAFHMNDLRIINLSNNPLTALGSGQFHHQVKLEMFNLSQTGLSSLPDSIFDNIKCLTNLDLSYNNFQAIQEQVFKSLNCLETLNLRGNNFRETGNIALVSARSSRLIELDISHNQFTTFQTQVLTSLGLHTLNIAYNPFLCNCDLLSFRNELVTLEASSVVFEDRNAVNCSNAPSVNLLDMASEKFWCPEKLGSCYYDSEEQTKLDILFSVSTPTADNQTCKEYCFDNSMDYGIFDTGLCICGNTDPSYSCWCATKVYADGGNMACTVPGTTTPVVYVSGVYQISAGLTIEPFGVLTAGQTNSFRAQVTLPTIVIYQWSFGDSTEILTGTSSAGLAYNAPHTYPIPGTYTLRVSACTANNSCTSISVPVEVRPSLGTESLDIVCPTTTPSLSSTINVAGTIHAGYNTELTWTKLPTDNVTATTVGECNSGLDFFRGRCLQNLPSPDTYSGAKSICNGGHLLTIHYPEEIPDVLSKYSSLSTIYLGAQKSGNGYVWTNGNQAYFMVGDVIDASIGECIVIDRSTGGLKGVACSTSHSILCQLAPNTECALGGHYYSDNGHCYKLYETSSDWPTAATACTTVYTQSELAVIDSSALGAFVVSNVFGSVTQEAWIGLTDRNAEAYLMWTNNQSTFNYNPVGSAPETDCYTLDKTGTWSAQSCKENKYYICQYSLRERVKVPSYLVGTGHLESLGTVYSLTTVPEVALPADVLNKINLFPGLWFSHQGEIQQWNFKTDIVDKDTLLVFQVYTPVCSTGTLIKPGCDRNGGRYASCSGTVSSCSAAPYCNEGKEVCYYTNTCINIADPCNCNTMNASFCSTPFVGDQPTYQLVGQTPVLLSAGPAGYYSVNANGIKVNEGDIIALQTDNIKDIITTDTNDIPNLQNALQSVRSTWVSTGETLDFSAVPSPWKNNTAFYFQAVYTIPQTVTMPQSLQYSTAAGAYTYQLSLPNDNLSKSCSITVEEDVGDLVWIYPSIQTTVSGVVTFYIDADVKTYLVFAVKRGTNLQVSWEINGVTTTSTLQSSCPSSVSSAVSSLCDSSEYRISQPFAYMEYTFPYNSGNPVSVNIYVNNSVGSGTKTVASQSFLPLDVTFNLTDFSHGYLVEISKVINFTTSVVSGNPTSYSYSLNGTIQSTSTSTSWTHTFTAKDVYEVAVEISDGYKTSNASVIISSRYAANVQNLVLVGVPSVVSIGNAVDFSITCSVNANAFVTLQWEFESGIQTESLETSSTSLSQTKSHTHAINGTYTFRILITDDFSNIEEQTQSVRVVERLTSVTLTASPIQIKTGASIDFIASVPNLASKDYGTLTYGFDYKDGTVDIGTLNERSHVFATSGTYEVKVNVTNQADTVEDVVTVEVLDEISGLTISTSSIVLVNSTATITASVITGNSLTYRFEISDNNLSSGNITNNVYKPYLDKTGHFNITLTAWNILSTVTVTKEIYVVDTSTFNIIGFTHENYVAAGSPLTVTVDVLYYDLSDLVLTWTFDGNLQKGSGSFTTSYTFNTAGIYNFTVTIQATSTGGFITGYSTVQVQESVSGLTVSSNSPVGLATGGSAIITFIAAATNGDSLRYTWNHNGAITTTSTNTFSTTKTSEVNGSISVMVWNDVSNQNGTATYEVQYLVEGLQITCLNCTFQNSNAYVESGSTASFIASITSGSGVAYNWDFGDGSTGVGISQTHSYSTGAVYTIILTAGNDVGSTSSNFNITVQEPVTSVIISCPHSIKFVNSTFTLQATAADGTDLSYTWQDCVTCPQIFHNSVNYTTGIYNKSGYHQVLVKVYNIFSTIVQTQNVNVLDYITYATINSNLIQGQYAAKNTPYNFAALSNTDHPDTFYEWKISDGSSYVFSTSHVNLNKNITHTFTSAVIYEVTVRVWNSLHSEHTTSINVTVQEEIAGGSIHFDKTSPVGTGEDVIITALVTQGTQLNYKWSLQNSTGTYLLSSTLKSFNHSFSIKGTYSFILEISNDLGTVTVNKAVTVMESVTGVSISSGVNESFPYIASGTTVSFTSILVTGESYTTTWTVADGISSALTFTGPNFSHLFSSSGTYTVTVKSSNVVSTGSYTMTIYVEGAINTLTVLPDSSLAQTGKSINVSANYNSGADNLVFEWTVDGNMQNLTVSSINHVFNSPGSFTVSLKVYNHISKMTDQVGIIIEVAVLGFAVSDCNVTRQVNNQVTSTLSVSQGTAVVYSYILETGTSTSKTGSGNSITHTFAQTGIYNLYVNASNQVSMESIQCIYTIIGPISGVAVDTSNSNFFVNYTVNFQVTGNNLIGVTYNWTFSPTNIVTSTQDSLLSKIFSAAGTYLYTLEVSNVINAETITGSFVIEPLHCDVMQVTIGGQENKIRKKSSTSTFEVTVEKNGCTHYTTSYEWKVYDGHCGSMVGNPVTLLSDTITNTPKLILDESLNVGQYCVQLTTLYDYTPLSQDVAYNLTVQDSDLVALIAGGSKMKYPGTSPIHVDGSSSFDPDSSTTVLSYGWACNVSYPLEPGHTTPPSGYSDACSGVTSSSSSTVVLAPGNLLSGQTYTITLTVSVNGRVSGTFTQKIEISSNDDPVPIIKCINCASKGSYIINAGQHMAFTGECFNCAVSDTKYYEWSVFTQDASSKRVQLTITSDMTSTGIHSENFVILAGNLPETNSQYIFKLEISKTSSVVTLQSSTEFILKANNKPSGGTCTLDTTSPVEPLTTPVQISCSGYTDPDNSNGELNYKVVSHSKDPASSGENVVIYYGTLQSPDFYLAPWPGTVRNTVKIRVYVVDENGAETLSLDTNVSISSTVTSGNQLSFLQTRATSNLVDLVSNNNPTKLLQYGIAFTHEMNELSRQESLLPNSHVDDRNKIRNIITVAVLFLPLETIYQQQQMAHILNLLTHYPGEYQTSSCQTLVLNQVDILKKDLEESAFQGANKNEFTSSLLLNAVSNSMDAVNAAVYSSVNISNVTTLDTNTLSSYKPMISTLSLPTSTSTEDHKRDIITRAFNFGDDIVILNLKTLLPLEDPVVITLDSIKVYGKRTWTDSIEQSYISDGCLAILHRDMLSTIYPTRQEVFQILMVIPQNPFTWGMVGDVKLTTKVIAAGFTDTSGTELSVSGIPEGKRPKFFIMKDGGSQYNLTDSIVNSTSYNPEAGLTFSSAIVQKSSVKKIIVDTSAGYDGAALHLMLKFAVVPNTAVKSNSTGVINAYLGKNYEATKSSYEQTKEIKLEHMEVGYDHRYYTMFVAYSDFDTDSSYTVTVYNDDPNFDVNISAAKYFSTCQYFDTSTNTWSTNGCASTEESVENYAVCECQHLTPFGGGMLAPPDSLSFTDLLNLDLATNPVVFITCSLIFVVYVVAVIICRRIDQSSLERISSIPLCGKDGSFKYEVTVITGRQPGAGTTANVGMKIYGEYGKTSSKQLDKKWAFQRNAQDTFIMAHDTNLGNIEKIMIWHDNSGLDPSWYLVQVIVKDLQTDVKYYFFANFWMSLEMEKGFVQKELTAAGSSEIQRFGRMFSRALSNCMADRHLWYSVLDRPALSRFTRVQRATCVVTILYTFMAINAMWYGLLKQEDDGDVSSFGWEEVVLSFVTNVMAFPFTLIIIWMFKRSKSKTNIFEHGPRIGTAQTIEMDYEGPAAGSFKTNDDEFLSYLDRESTTDSLVEASMTHTNLRRSRTLKITRQATDDSLSKAVNSFDSGIGMSQEGKLKRTNNPHLWSKTDGSQKDETYITKTEGNNKAERKEEVKEAADGILQYLDDIESECMTKEQSVIQKRRSNIQRTATKKTDWKEVDDILHSDTESRSSSKSRPLRKKASTSTIGSYGKPASSQSIKGYSPREDPNINGHDRKLPSAGSTFIWAKNLRNTQSLDSTGMVEGIGPLEPDIGLAQQSNPNIEQDEMQLLEKREESKSCTLPAWFVKVAYVICFLLCVTSVTMVIMYGQKFGRDVAIQWILALLFCVSMSFIVIEPLKALVIAFYASSVLKKEDTIDEDAIDIMPTVDTSNEKVKENKFTPLAGFALLNAKEEGQKILRMRLMLRQFIAYIFYLWLIMTLCYVNFNHDSYMFKTSVNHVMLQTTVPNMEKSFVNISDVDEFWSWTQSALVTGLHHRELYTDLEFGTLLGVARMRLVRSIEDTCPATEHPMISGLDSLTNRTCWGNFGYNEDKKNYGEQWNYSQNLSWQYYDSSETGSKTRFGYVYTYGGGGYVQELGTTYNNTLDKLKELQTKNWIDERTRAIFIDFTMYSAANDLTTVVNLMIEFPLTGGLNTSSDIQSQVLLRFVQNVVDPLMVCQCILFLVNVYLVCHIINSIRIQGKTHLSDPWNWFEILTTLMAIVINGLYIGCVVEASSTFTDYFNNKYGFTNFEAISDTHVAMRYVQGILIFFLMFKVVKQLRFIKFLYVYERTLSDACGRLAGVAVIFFIMFCSFGMAAYLWYGRSVDGFETYWHTLTSLVGMLHGHFSFWTLMDSDRVFTHFFLYSYYAFCYGITIALILAVLRDSYRTTKGQMFFKATMDMQDYEMVEFMMKRFKLWAGIDKPKQGIRRVHFDRRMFSASSRGSRPSSRDSMLSYDPFETNPRTTRHAAERLEETWEDCLCTLERVCGLDDKEDEIIKSTQKGIDEWKFQTRIKNYEKELQGTSEKPPKGAPSGTHAVPRASKIPRRTSTTGCEAGNSKRGLGTPDTRTTSLRGRPLSDQGGRAPPQPKRTNSRERFSIYNFFKSVNPSKDAWK